MSKLLILLASTIVTLTISAATIECSHVSLNAPLVITATNKTTHIKTVVDNKPCFVHIENYNNLSENEDYIEFYNANHRITYPLDCKKVK